MNEEKDTELKCHVLLHLININICVLTFEEEMLVILFSLLDCEIPFEIFGHCICVAVHLICTNKQENHYYV